MRSGEWLRRYITALAFLSLAAGWGGTGLSVAAAQISPGPLASAHEKLEGALQCSACHGTGGKAAMSARCLDCHKEIAWLTARELGLHGREASQPCATCHPDHAGRDFKLITWTEGDSTRFDHGRTGWLLDRSHRTAKCGDCHKAEFRRSPVATMSQRSRSAPGWLGLDRACATCHEDIHRGTLPANCLECHDTREWKPAPRFNHAKTRYPLTGKHLEVRCNECHLDPKRVVVRNAAGQPIPVYRPLPFQRCADCHADPHQGALGADCAGCHETGAFTKVARGKFDHDRTRYPLRGRHASVACAKCHVDFSTPRGKKPAFSSCTACHADPHAGTATLAGKPADCVACHGLEGFRPSTFTLSQHRNTRYPLEGKHAQLNCGACHLKSPVRQSVARLGSSGVLMHPPAGRCRDCHGEDHGSQQLAAGTGTDDCGYCHKVAGWKPTSFGISAHARLRLALDGRHGEIPCSACHGPNRAGLPALPPKTRLGRAGVALRPRETDCVSCHVDAHEGRFAGGGTRPQPAGCVACHDTRRFRPSTIDVQLHGKFAFPLEGAHRAVPCAGCHGDMKRAAGGSWLLLSTQGRPGLSFTIAQQGCEACHTNPHGTQFAGRSGCGNCHGLDAFRPAARFDHERDAAFSLKGAHATVPCSSCHLEKRNASGSRLVVWRPLSGKCESCHTTGSTRQ